MPLYRVLGLVVAGVLFLLFIVVTGHRRFGIPAKLPFFAPRSTLHPPGTRTRPGPRPKTRADYELTPEKRRNATFTPRTSGELCDLAALKPRHTADAATAKHVGMWLHTSGLIYDVTDDPNTDVVVVSIREDTTNTPVFLTLSLKHQQLALSFTPDVDRIEANGRIIGIHAGAISLAPVEILKYGSDVRPPDATT